jgi:hypothetical protein
MDLKVKEKEVITIGRILRARSGCKRILRARYLPGA